MFYNFMTDIETTSTSPDFGGILQIACVPFDLQSREISHDMFNFSMWLPTHRFWDESTRSWWMSQNQEVYAKITEKALDPTETMRSFSEWVTGIAGIMPPMFWAKPITFDYPFCSSYFKQLGINNPFHYRNARDVNTFIEARTQRPINETWDKVQAKGDKHNALHDCIFQVEGLFHACS